MMKLYAASVLAFADAGFMAKRKVQMAVDHVENVKSAELKMPKLAPLSFAGKSETPGFKLPVFPTKIDVAHLTFPRSAPSALTRAPGAPKAWKLSPTFAGASRSLPRASKPAAHTAAPKFNWRAYHAKVFEASKASKARTVRPSKAHPKFAPRTSHASAKVQGRKVWSPAATLPKRAAPMAPRTRAPKVNKFSWSKVQKAARFGSSKVHTAPKVNRFDWSKVAKAHPRKVVAPKAPRQHLSQLNKTVWSKYSNYSKTPFTVPRKFQRAPVSAPRKFGATAPKARRAHASYPKTKFDWSKFPATQVVSPKTVAPRTAGAKLSRTAAAAPKAAKFVRKPAFPTKRAKSATAARSAGPQAADLKKLQAKMSAMFKQIEM